MVTSMLDLEVLVLELGAVDALAACAVALGEVPALSSQLGEHTESSCWRRLPGT